MSATASKNGVPLTVAALAEAKRLPPDHLAKLGLHDLRGGGVGVPYYGITGEDGPVKQRTALAAREGSYWPAGQPLQVYGLWKVHEARAARILFLVEGESDSWTLWLHCLPCLGIPGADTAKVLMREHLECIDAVYVHQEPDRGGEQFVKGVLARLRGLGFDGKAYELRMPDGLKDPADLHAQDPARFLGRFQAAVTASAPLDLRATGGQREQAPRVSGASKESTPAKRVRPLAAYQSFPVEALPSPVREYVLQAAAALRCDPSFLALPCLSVVAAVVGNSRVIRLKRGWEEPSVVWSAIIGDSGTLKSPAYLKSVAYLFRLQKRLLLEYKKAAARYQEDLAEYKAAKRRAKDGEAQTPVTRREEPVRQRVVCSDTTVEKLAEILEDNPRGTLAARDELSAWLGSFTRYKGKQGGTDLPIWLEFFRAGTAIIDRKTGDRKTLYIERAAVSVTGGIQPGVIARALTPEFLDAGLAARLLMVMPPKMPKRWTEAEVEPDVENAYHDLLDKLLALDFDTSGEEKAPHVLDLSPDGKAAWVTFYNDWAREQAAVEGELAAAFSKLEAYAARFAMLFHVITHVSLDTSDLRPVGPRSIEAGAALCRWFAQEAIRIYGTLSESAQERDTRHLVEFILARGGSITVRELQRSNCRKYPASEDAEDALDALAKTGLAVWSDWPKTERGGHPTRVLQLRMTHDRTDTTQPARQADEPSPHDATSDSTRGHPRNPRDSVGSVGSVMRHADDGAVAGGNGPALDGEVLSDAGGADGSDSEVL